MSNPINWGNNQNLWSGGGTSGIWTSIDTSGLNQSSLEQELNQILTQESSLSSLLMGSLQGSQAFGSGLPSLSSIMNFGSSGSSGASGSTSGNIGSGAPAGNQTDATQTYESGGATAILPAGSTFTATAWTPSREWAGALRHAHYTILDPNTQQPVGSITFTEPLSGNFSATNASGQPYIIISDQCGNNPIPNNAGPATGNVVPKGSQEYNTLYQELINTPPHATTIQDGWTKMAYAPLNYSADTHTETYGATTGVDWTRGTPGSSDYQHIQYDAATGEITEIGLPPSSATTGGNSTSSGGGTAPPRVTINSNDNPLNVGIKDGYNSWLNQLNGDQQGTTTWTNPNNSSNYSTKTFVKDAQGDMTETDTDSGSAGPGSTQTQTLHYDAATGTITWNFQINRPDGTQESTSNQYTFQADGSLVKNYTDTTRQNGQQSVTHSETDVANADGSTTKTIDGGVPTEYPSYYTPNPGPFTSANYGDLVYFPPPGQPGNGETAKSGGPMYYDATTGEWSARFPGGAIPRDDNASELAAAKTGGWFMVTPPGETAQNHGLPEFAAVQPGQQTPTVPPIPPYTGPFYP